MTGLCGYVRASLADKRPGDVVQAMAHGLMQRRDVQGWAEFDRQAALHVARTGDAAGFVREGTLWGAIDGYPRWAIPELDRLAGAKGHAAALLEAYRRFGSELFDHLSGPFSLAVIEPSADRALIAIDRFGVHAMSWAIAPRGGLVFGTSTQAVRAHPAVTSTIAPQAVYDFLFCYVCPAPNTIYSEQQKLLPGQFLEYREGRARVRNYWRMPYGSDDSKGNDQRIAELHSLLEQATRRTLDGEASEQVGAFLSGGLDSSTVVGYLSKLNGGTPKTFTVVFGAGSYDESHYARIVADQFGADRHEYRLSPRDALELIPRLAEAYDEPFGNSSAIPAYYCARVAHDQGVDLLLAGDGGDELFGGNERYVTHKFLGLYGALPRFLRAGLIEPTAASLAPLGRLFRKADNAVRYASTPLPDRLEYYNFWRSAVAAEVFEPDFLAEVDIQAPIDLRRRLYDETTSEDQLQRLMHLDLTAALADNDLRKVNRMSALAGVRVRYPFLDEDLAAFAARIPPKQLIQGRRLRAFYKRAMRGFLPREVLAKPKHGFGMPFAEWMKQDPDIRALARDSLIALKSRGYLRPEFLDRVVQAHGRPGRSEVDEIVWDLTILEVWLQAH